MEITEEDALEIVNKIKSDPQRLIEYERIVELIQGNYKIAGRSDITSKTIAFLESNNVIESITDGIYRFSNLGKKVLKIMSN